jgi:GYF domain 2
MSTPLLVKISRDGKEIGTYEAKEAVRLLVYGTLRETDFYWHEGMTDWAPLSKLQASEARRELAERVLQQKEQEAIKAEQLAQEKDKAKEQENRAVTEAVRVRLKNERATWFRCHCCRESFRTPDDPRDQFWTAIILLLVAGGLFLIPILGPLLAGILSIYAFLVLLASWIVSPHCPMCRSNNFSRPERTDEQK